MHESLTPGTRLGRYDIVALLDAGGMGEVYRAHDAELGRAVAIKILPAAFADHPDRLRRFELEARAAAALNHPNILAVHDVGRHDGTPYIVSELLEGQSLRARLDGAALPLRKAVEFGMQIAEGLAAAHDKGIVHRDLKPENIFVTPDEHLKILDFGLAKLVDLDAATLTAAPHTSAGVVLGTVGYLSPEQASGLPADHRSDIFSVGTMLFEMVTHRRAFARATAAQTLTAVLEDDPTASIAVGAGPSARVMNLVRRCIDKSPERRFQSARDLALVLNNELSDSSLGSSGFARARMPRLSTVALALACLVIGTLIGRAIVRSTVQSGGARGDGPTRLTIALPANLPPSYGSPVAISPDGSRLALMISGNFGSTGDLFVFDLNTNVSTRLTLDGSIGGNKAWSADGKRLLFNSQREGPSNVFVQAADGTGTAERIMPDADFQSPSSWLRDGNTISYVQGHPPAGADIWAMRLSDRTRWPLVVLPARQYGGRVSPDERWLAYTDNTSGTTEAFITTYPQPGPRWQVSARGGQEVAWSPDSRELYFRQDTRMFAVRVDAAGNPPVGRANVLFEGRYLYEPNNPAVPHYDVAPDGRFLMVSSDAGPPDQVQVVLNWTKHLAARLTQDR